MSTPRNKRSSNLLGVRNMVGPITKRVPALHRTLVAMYHLAVLEARPRLARLIRGEAAARGADGELDAFLSLQRELVLQTALAAPTDAAALAAALRAAGCTVHEGGWTLYVAPTAALLKLVPGLDLYPAGTGLKILKDLRGPSEAEYAANHLRPVPGAAAVRARTPKPRELLRIAAHLRAAKIAPRTLDLVQLDAGGAALTAFVCEHVEGGAPNAAQHAEFIARLDRLLAERVIGVTHGSHAVSSDFAAPDCNGNLIQPLGTGHAQFIDTQAFCFQDERAGLESWATRHAAALGFGAGRLGRGSRYLYQTVPGLGPAKRATLDRWERLDALLRDAGVTLDDRVTFDIGCNSGLMSYYALARGARWAFGWDRPATAAAAAELLPLLGGSRFTATGAEIGAATQFLPAVPSALRGDRRGVLFFLSVSDHIGFPAGVGELPWRTCVYEGHNGQSAQTALDMIHGCGWCARPKVLTQALLRDGDSPARPIVIFEREG